MSASKTLAFAVALLAATAAQAQMPPQDAAPAAASVPPAGDNGDAALQKLMNTTAAPAAPSADPLANLLKSATTPAPAQELPPPAEALPRVAPPPPNVLNKINSLNAEISVLEHEVRRAKLVKELSKAQAPEKSAEEEKASTKPARPETIEPAEENNLPVVAAVTGTGGDLKARLVLPGGASTIVAKGQRVPNGFRVQEIAPSGVRLVSEKSGKSFHIGLGSFVADPAPKTAMPMFPPAIPLQ